MRGRRARMSLAALVVGDAVLAGVALGFSAGRGTDQPSQRETVVVTSAPSLSPPDGNGALPAVDVAVAGNGAPSPASTPTTATTAPGPSSTTRATTTTSMPAEIAETPSSTTTALPGTTTSTTSTTLAPEPTRPTAAPGGGVSG